MCNCHCNTGINRDGSGQLSRYLRALDPGYIPVDERSLEDWLVFAKGYAAQIRFYDMPASKINDPTDPKKISWREFFRRDMAVIAASIAVTDPLQIKTTYDTARAALELTPTPAAFAALFGPILSIMNLLDHWYTQAIPQNPLREDLQLGIDSSLHDQVKKMIAYEMGFKIVDPKAVLNLDFSDIENPERWGIHDAIDPDTSIYEGTAETGKIRYAALFIDDIWLSFYGFLSTLVNTSDKYLQFALQQYPGHQPHMALFIAFLQIFDIARQQMNGLTAKMLDFYYQQVLQLPSKPSIPDKAFVVFQLAKGVLEYDLVQNTPLNGGKDASGKDLVYATEADFVINQATVKELKNLFIDKSAANAAGIKTLTGFYGRPVANSQDGYGAPFTDPTGKWLTFGKGSPYSLLSKNPCQLANQLKEELGRTDQSQIGFAIASPQLLLLGGKRIVRLRIFNDNAGTQLKSPFNIILSAEKGWLKIARQMTADEYNLLNKYLVAGIINAEPAAAAIGSSYYIESTGFVFIYLPLSEQAVVNFDPKLHTGADYRTSYPVLQVMLTPQAQLTEHATGFLPASQLSMDIRVGSTQPSEATLNTLKANNPTLLNELPGGPFFDGLHQLVLQNENGLLPSGKPFDPFTAYPDKGKSFYIGSPEIFNKPVDELSVHIDFARGKPLLETTKVVKGVEKAAIIIPPLGVNVLESRQWTILKSENDTDFNSVNLEQNILQVPSAASDAGVVTMQQHSLVRRPILPVTEWNAQAEKGFLRVTYLKDVPVAANSSFLQSSQELAPALKINVLALSYHSFLQQPEAGIDQVFHVYPFGVTETYVRISAKPAQTGGLISKEPHEYTKLRQLKNGLLVDAGNRLLPQFTYTSPYAVFNQTPPAAPVGKVRAMAAGIQTLTSAVKPDYPRMLAYGAGLQNEAQAINQYSGTVEEQGTLYIGIENTQPLEMLSLLFQFAEGSADDEDDDPPPIHWSYLSYNEWKPLKGEWLVADGTFGFQATGIIKLSVPADANNQHTIATNGLYWFSASVTDNANRIPRLIAIVAQAAEVVFVDNGNDQAHFNQALAAGSIGKLVKPVNEVSSVTQPFASFDGKHKEQGKEYYTRVSERLRHKGRAITAWDYEHLVLDRFPSIYKVKCIPHTDPNCLCRHTQAATKAPAPVSAARAEAMLENAFRQLAGEREREHPSANCCGPQVAPGHVLLVPIADLKNRNAVNPLQPKTSRRTLLEIEAWLQTKVSPFVHVHAKNPVYEEIIVTFRVKFFEGYDIGYYLKKLNEEIVHFLTPWAFDANAEVKFGQEIYASSIITFIEQRIYVDFITDFFMAVCREECCPGEHEHDEHPAPAGTPVQAVDLSAAIAKACNCEAVLHLVTGINRFKGEIVARPSGPRSILVSVPQHIIIPYEAPEQLTPCEKRRQPSK